MKLNKFLGVAGAAALATFTLAACGKGGTPTNNTLTVWGPENQQIVLKDLCKKFKEENPDFKLDIKVGLVAETDITTKMQTDIAGSADVFAYANDATARLARLGAVAEVAGANLEHVKKINDPSSIKAAQAADGKVFGYPLTGDNGYFLYYNKAELTLDDVKTFDSLLKKANQLKKHFIMDLDNSWYDAGFFFGTGCTYGVKYDDKYKETEITCDFNNENGLIAAKAMMDIASYQEVANSKKGGFINGADDEIKAGFKNGTCIAAISGTWNASDIEGSLGENYAATKLPEFIVDGQSYQMGSFAGYKLMGVNSQSKHLDEAHQLAKYLTDEAAQEYRYDKTSVGPSAIKVQNMEKVQKDVALSALMLQNKFAVPQESVPSNYWSAVEAFGKQVCATDDKKITLDNVQSALDKMVALIKTTVAPK